VVCAFGGREHGEQGVGEHRDQGPAAPGGPAADLVLIEPGQALTGLEGFLDAPAAPATRTNSGSPTGRAAVAAEVGQLAVAGMAADQQPLVPDTGGAGVGAGEGDPGPVVDPRSLRAGAGGTSLPGVFG